VRCCERFCIRERLPERHFPRPSDGKTLTDLLRPSSQSAAERPLSSAVMAVEGTNRRGGNGSNSADRTALPMLRERESRRCAIVKSATLDAALGSR
jgi:hypothetical protein